MAVDTAQKRFSMLRFSWLPGLLVFEPDGSVDADDRSMLLHLYAGITLSGPAAGHVFRLVGVGGGLIGTDGIIKVHMEMMR